MLDWKALEPEKRRPLRRVEYDQLVKAGVFDDERVELLHGWLVTMSPQGWDHATVTDEIVRQFYLQLVALGVVEAYSVRAHSPYAASEYSEPEPDVLVTSRIRPGERHPERALLLVEVADSSLRKDRTIKTGIYAEAGVPEYWVVDVEAGAVEVYTQPHEGEYRMMTRVERGGTLRPMALAGVEIAVSEILPPRS